VSATVLTYSEVCAALRVSAPTLRGIIASGELRARKVGASWRIRSDDLEA
jgi:excisionase family DNA binding protein